MDAKMGFGLKDYQTFTKAVGEFLGKQFEPVTFANMLHQIKFFDIENYTFITKENRHIPIDNLSQGQSKITTLTGSFKEMEEGRKKIVLIDEIADLDPENLQRVKDVLNEKLAEGKLALAVLVRPSHDPASKPVSICGWG
jgi:ABC-type iron transport system FetAB ATPase subunit